MQLLVLSLIGQFNPPPPSPSPSPPPPLPPGQPPPPDLDYLPDRRVLTNIERARIRKDIFASTGFDKIVPPTSVRDGPVTGSVSGTDVSVQLRIFKISEVSAATGTMKLKVWLRMRWVDTRLAWNITEYSDVSENYFNADAYPGAENAEIWTPDITVYNANQGFAATMEPSMAKVDFGGNVYYSRPGQLEVMCKFSGLVAFPFDTLKCKFEVGGWLLSRYQQGINLIGKGVDLTTNEVTSGASYQQYSIKSVNVTQGSYAYDDFPAEPWPVIIYTVEIKRAGTFYTFMYILPGVVVTLLSFAVFFIDTAAADPMSYGITVIVVNFLSQLVLVNMLPVCGELIWIDLFYIVNTLFCCISLFQSAFNAMLENMGDRYFLPLWIVYSSQFIYNKLMEALCFVAKSEVIPDRFRMKDTRKAQDDKEAKEANKNDPFEILATSDALSESVSGLLYRQHKSAGERFARLTPEEKTEQMDNNELAERLSFFEKLFFDLQDETGNVDKYECEGLLSYACLDMEPGQRGKILKRFDPNEDGNFSRVEFCEMCYETMWNVPPAFLERAVNNLKSAREGKKQQYNLRWRAMAEKIDNWSRAVIPLLYLLSMLVVFNIKLSDNYEEKGSVMFEGLGPATFSPVGGSIVGFFFLASIGGFIGWYLMGRITAVATQARTRSFRKAVVDSSDAVTAGAAYLRREHHRSLLEVTSTTSPKKGSHGKQKESACQSSLPKAPLRILPKSKKTAV